jgi:hypothetical protein
MDNIALIIASAVSVLGTIFGIYLKNKLEYNKKNSIENSTVSGVNIYKALEYLQSETGAARSYVFEFHNGEHFFSGRGQQKFSCTYEHVRAGVSAEAINSQGHRISNFNKYIRSLVEEGKYVSKDVQKINDEAFKSLLISKGVMALYNVPIKTLNNKIIGILGIEYISPVEKFDFGNRHEDIDRFMRVQARTISGYLI